MRRLLAVSLVAMLIACVPADPAESPRSTKRIFREVSVARGELIRLGEPIGEDIRPYLERTAKNQFRMRPGTFGGADTLVVIVDDKARVTAMHFIYAPGSNYESSLREYEEALGPPTERINSGAPDEVRARWEDAATVFEMVRNGDRVHSVLSDRRVSGPA